MPGALLREGANFPLRFSPRVFCMFRPFLPLIAAVCLTTAAAFSFAGQGPAILANPVISATVTAIENVSPAYRGEAYKRTPVASMACRFKGAARVALAQVAGDSRRSPASAGDLRNRTPVSVDACIFRYWERGAAPASNMFDKPSGGESQPFNGDCRRTLQVDSVPHPARETCNRRQVCQPIILILCPRLVNHRHPFPRWRIACL